MEQLEMNVNNTDDYLLANGYSIPAVMSPRIEAKFGALMRSSIDPGGVYSKPGSGLPKGTDTSDKLKVALSKTAPTRDAVLRIVSDMVHITSPELAHYMGIDKNHAGSHLKNLRKSGFVKVVKQSKGQHGSKMYTYALKPLGVELLKALEDKA